MTQLRSNIQAATEKLLELLGLIEAEKARREAEALAAVQTLPVAAIGKIPVRRFPPGLLPGLIRLGLVDTDGNWILRPGAGTPIELPDGSFLKNLAGGS